MNNRAIQKLHLRTFALWRRHFHKKQRIRGKKIVADPLPSRSYAMAWHQYIQGGVVSRHQVRIIREFMNANCGRSKRQDIVEEDGKFNQRASFRRDRGAE